LADIHETNCRSLNPCKCAEFLADNNRFKEVKNAGTGILFFFILKGPKHEIFGFGVFKEIGPVWVGLRN
jgi:hypothetical protein